MFILSTSRARRGTVPQRAGRLLIECLLALVLLALCAQLVTALTRSVSWSTEQAHLTTTAWSLATQAIESDAARRCDSTSVGGGTGALSRPRVNATWTEQALGSWRTRDLRVVGMPSALAASVKASVGRAGGGDGRITLSLTSARSCR